MSKGTKRASPGAEEEKSPLANVELSDEDAKKLTACQNDLQRVELILERQAQAALRPVYEKRREITKTVPNFWPVALMNNTLVSYHAQHGVDQTALAYLEDIWVEKDSADHRCFTLEFHFKENPFFSDKVLKKEYKYLPPPAAESDEPDKDGITKAMLDFNWERDVKISANKINWKDADKALTKLHPRVSDDEGEEVLDPGSFFNFFENDTDPSEVGVTIANEIFPEAIEFFLGNAPTDDFDEDSEDSEDDDDDAEEIDLEKPRAKKRKV